MKKIKNINWFWKNWTEDEKRIYKKCAVFAVIVIMLEIVATIICANQFHATDTRDTGDIIVDDRNLGEVFEDAVDDYEEHNPLDGYWGTEWNDEKGEWEKVWKLYKKDEHGNIVGEYYEMDVDNSLYIFKRIFNIIYSSVLPITSVLAATLVGYHYLMIMTSKNKRRIEDSYAAIKSVAIVWLYIMCISVFITLAMQGFNQIVNSEFANPILKP